MVSFVKHRSSIDVKHESKETPVTTRQVKQLYERPSSFTDLLPWREYNPASRTFLLEDGISVGALFEITAAGTEARTPEFMAQLRDAIQTALTDAIPEEDESPWILQVYVQDEPSLQGFQKVIANYAQPSARDTDYTQHLAPYKSNSRSISESTVACFCP